MNFDLLTPSLGSGGGGGGGEGGRGIEGTAGKIFATILLHS